MLNNFLTRLQKVHRAQTRLEKEAIYRLRYNVYIDELKKGFLPNADHDNKMVRDAEDDRPGTGLFYTGKADNPSGTIRVDIFHPGEVPDEVAQRFSLHLFPWLSEVPVAELGRLIISPSHRGALILPALARQVYEFAVRDKGVSIGFLYCAPGLVKAYARLGFRPYAGELVFNSDGVRVPMIMIASDLDFFKAARSPLFPLVKQYFSPRPGKAGLEPVDMKKFTGLLGDDSAPYQLNPDEICHQIEDEFFRAQSGKSQLIKGLSEKVVRALSEKGFIIEVPEGKVLIREGLHEKEMFVILQGVFEVFSENTSIAMLHSGDIFGELAFFLDSGKRTASIRSLSSGKVLALRRKFLDELIESQPELAARLLLNINTITANRMAGMLSGYDRE